MSYDQIGQAVWAAEGGAIDFPSSSYIFILSVYSKPRDQMDGDNKHKEKRCIIHSIRSNKGKRINHLCAHMFLIHRRIREKRRINEGKKNKEIV